MNTITLPDHISFEELADKWCEENYDNAIRLRYETYFFVIYKERFCKLSALFHPDTRSFEIENEEKFQPILDYIKERSNV
jgi:hypothetical protein